jgi:hypothetical protein
MVMEIDEEEDEIATLAREKMILGHGCHEAIDRNIADAENAGRWDELHKWYRVRLRAQRMRQELNMNYALEAGAERRNAAYAAKR